MSNHPKIFGKTLKLSWSEMTIGLATSALGLILAVCPGLASSVVFNFIGIIGIVIGAIQLIRYFTMDPQASLKSNGMFVGLMWLAGGPAALCASALSGEIILRRAFRKGPRPVLCACLLLPALVLVLAWPERLPRWFGLLLPWRGAVSLITGGLILLLGRKRR